MGTSFLVLIIALAPSASPEQTSPVHTLQIHRPAYPVSCLPQCLAEVSTFCSPSSSIRKLAGFQSLGIGWAKVAALSAERHTNTSWLKGKLVLSNLSGNFCDW